MSFGIPSIPIPVCGDTHGCALFQTSETLGLSTLLVHACAGFCLCTSYRNFHVMYFCVKTGKNEWFKQGGA